MKEILCLAGALFLVGIIVVYVAAHRPSVLRNEANGPTNLTRFKGYKESLKTPINGGVPVYGEGVTGWTSSDFRSGKVS